MDWLQKGTRGIAQPPSKHEGDAEKRNGSLITDNLYRYREVTLLFIRVSSVALIIMEAI
jgi:hypothetical protein